MPNGLCWRIPPTTLVNWDMPDSIQQDCVFTGLANGTTSVNSLDLDHNPDFKTMRALLKDAPFLHPNFSQLEWPSIERILCPVALVSKTAQSPPDVRESTSIGSTFPTQEFGVLSATSSSSEMLHQHGTDLGFMMHSQHHYDLS